MDGQMEQVNQEIEAYLWVFVSHHQDDWADWLPLAAFAYNNHIHSATCHTPFELDSTQHPAPIPEHLLNLRPNPVLIDGSKEYEVESIVDSKYRYQCLHYLVKLKGWPDSNNEWLPADHLANAPDIMQDFHLRYPSAPTLHHISNL